MKLKKRKIFIVGSGVIGAYLSRFLVKKKYEIIVTSRKNRGYEKNYLKLNIKNEVKFIKLDVLNKKKIESLILKFHPEAIFYLAGQSSVSESFKKNSNTFKSNYVGALNFLKILKKKKLNTKYYTIYFDKNSENLNKYLNISFVMKKKIGNAVKRNKIKRKLKYAVQKIARESTLIDLNYTYVIFGKNNVYKDKFALIFKELENIFKKIKQIGA